MKPGNTITRGNLEWTVERIQLRGVDEKWAKLVIYSGSGKAARLINEKWIRYDKGR
jgi:hypothetical protein